MVLGNLGTKLLQISRSTPYLTTALIGHKLVRACCSESNKQTAARLLTMSGCIHESQCERHSREGGPPCCERLHAACRLQNQA